MLIIIRDAADYTYFNMDWSIVKFKMDTKSGSRIGISKSSFPVFIASFIFSTMEMRLSSIAVRFDLTVKSFV